MTNHFDDVELYQFGQHTLPEANSMEHPICAICDQGSLLTASQNYLHLYNKALGSPFLGFTKERGVSMISSHEVP